MNSLQCYVVDIWRCNLSTTLSQHCVFAGKLSKKTLHILVRDNNFHEVRNKLLIPFQVWVETYIFDHCKETSIIRSGLVPEFTVVG